MDLLPSGWRLKDNVVNDLSDFLHAAALVHILEVWTYMIAGVHLIKI